MRTVIISVLLITLSKLSFADDQRVNTIFKSKNGKYSIQYYKKKWALKDSSGKVYYSIKDHGYTSMTICVSNDGLRLAILNDFVEGHKIGQRPALMLFNKGQMTVSYKLTDIVSDTCNVAYTIWHILWSLEDFAFKNADSIFSLATFEFTEFEFDTFTGRITKKSKPARFDENTLIVYGKFTKNDSDETIMTILKYIAGPKQPNDKLTFKAHYYGPGNWSQVLMIKNGEDITPLRFKNDMPRTSCLPN